MAVDFPFVSAVICERVLQEKDDVLSAIRLVDAFIVPKDRSENFGVQFTLLLALKAVSPIDPAGYQLGVTLIRSTGERERLIEPAEPLHPEARFADPLIPWGIGAAIPVRLQVRNLGTAYLEVDINGTVITRVPFTLIEPPTEQASK